MASKRNASKPKPFNLSWNQNGKLKKSSGAEYNIVGFGIPADKDVIVNGERLNTCPGALACRAVCYAKQGGYLWPDAIASRDRNMASTLLPNFAALAIADLKRKRSMNVVRIHDSGDFYNQEYLDKWADIARALPEKIFYAYTKTLGILNLTSLPPNLRITQSLGGKHDDKVDLSLPHSRIFSSPEARDAAGYIDGNVNDIPAIEGEIRIGLVYHGVKKLTLAQVNFFK